MDSAHINLICNVCGYVLLKKKTWLGFQSELESYEDEERVRREAEAHHMAYVRGRRRRGGI